MASPETRSFLRQSRKKLLEMKQSSNKTSSDSIEIDIRVGPTQEFAAAQHVDPFARLGPVAAEDLLRIECGDKTTITIPRQVAFHSGLIRRIFESTGNYREKATQSIVLETIDSPIAQKIFNYCLEDYIENHKRLSPTAPSSSARRSLFGSYEDDNISNEIDIIDLSSHSPVDMPSRDLPLRQSLESLSLSLSTSPKKSSSFGSAQSRSPKKYYEDLLVHSPLNNSSSCVSSSSSSTAARRVVFSVEMTPSEVMDIMMASHYLDIPDLLAIACSMIAHHIDDVDTASLHLIPPEALYLIYSNLSPERLCRLEREQEQFAGSSSLDTSSLWQRAVERRGWSAAEGPNSHSCIWVPELKAVEKQIEMAQILHNRSLGLAEIGMGGAGDPCWKAIYLQNELQRRMDLIFPGASLSDLESLIELAELSSDWITSIAIRPGSGIFELEPEFNILSKLNQLKSIDFSDTIMKKREMERLTAQLRAGQNRHLQELKLHRCGISDKTLGILVEYLRESSPDQARIRNLDLAENELTNHALILLASALAENIPLERLSLRDNQISSFFKYSFEEDTEWLAAGSADPHHDSSTLPDPVDPLLLSLGRNRTLKILDLSFNSLNLCYASAAALEALRSNPALEVLLLRDNALVRDATSSQQLELLIMNLPRTLTHLNLSHCGIGPEHVDQLALALSRDDSALEHLDISDNMLGRGASPQIARLIQSATRLKSLDISSNNLWDSGGRDLAEALRKIGRGGLGLRCLNVERNNLGRATVDIAHVCAANLNLAAAQPSQNGTPDLASPQERAPVICMLRVVNMQNNRVPGAVLPQIQSACDAWPFFDLSL